MPDGLRGLARVRRVGRHRRVTLENACSTTTFDDEQIQEPVVAVAGRAQPPQATAGPVSKNPIRLFSKQLIP
ncbi:hypothetical protein MMAD_52300 [Mycolicibacterium madagascariense]|uniref:Uncharacterized protein n=1 Tax=Mycolicibacterium madagascariense TaxID=212765 RepID=A0A7I7XP15_9MYCO|nr:hypothetical protein MMAD_52300 [Mycolicibacterium madagascariense]